MLMFLSLRMQIEYDALARAVPYGIYDVSRNRGSVYVGISADTPAFAVAALALWWEEEGRSTIPKPNRCSS